MFWRKKKEQSNKSKKIKILGVFIFILHFLGAIIFFLQPKRLRKFIKGEKKELEELATHKESFGRFLKDSNKLVRDLFIPHDGNDHKPKTLRPKSLATYVALAIIVKLVVTGFLFFTYPTPAELSAIVSANMINLVNESRLEAGVEPVKENTFLADFAQAKGGDMIARDYFSHDTPEGKRPWQWINRGDYDYVYAGENLAMDFVSAEVVHAAFLKSPTHRKNILNPKYKEIGIAVVNGDMNGHNTILLVQFFGTQRRDLSTLALGKTIEPEVIPDDFIQPPNIAGEENVPDLTDEVIAETKEPILEANPTQAANEGIIVVATTQKTSKALVDLVIEYSNIFFVAFLIFILISLFLNIFVKIRVQHASILLQSAVVIALLIAMILVKFHFVEQVAPQILIL